MLTLLYIVGIVAWLACGAIGSFVIARRGWKNEFGDLEGFYDITPFITVAFGPINLLATLAIFGPYLKRP